MIRPSPWSVRLALMAAFAAAAHPVGAGPGFERLIDIRAGNAFLDPETEAMLVGITPPWEDL